MEPPVQSFNDPALKAALARSLPKERAPQGLRDRIVALSAPQGSQSAAAEEAPPIKLPIFRQKWVRMAAAALFAIAALITAFIVNRETGVQPGYEIANSVYKGMITTHEARKNESTPSDTVTTLPSAGQQLSKQLGRGVWAPDLTKDGWTFHGGAIRTIGSSQVAQLYFTKGTESLSVLSLPSSLAKGAKDGSTYETTFSGTPIAGFLKKDGLFCIVRQGQAEPSTREIKALLDKHRDAVVKA
jgi:hypothetical protein